MPYQKLPGQNDGTCTVCTSPANILQLEFGVGSVVNCSRCGDFHVDHVVADDVPLPLADQKQMALASHLIRKLQKQKRALLTREFFASQKNQSLPTPAELCDNLLLWLAEQMDGWVGRTVGTGREISDSDILAEIGAIEAGGVRWAAQALKDADLVELGFIGTTNQFRAGLTPAGWTRVEELQRAHVTSRFAFFARKFANIEPKEGSRTKMVAQSCCRPPNICRFCAKPTVRCSAVCSEIECCTSLQSTLVRLQPSDP